MKRKRERDKLKKSLILRWGFSYFAIFIIPFVLYVIFVIISSFLLFRSVLNSNSIALDASTRLIDMAIDEEASLSEDVVLSQSLRDVLLPSSMVNDTFSLYEASTEFRHLLNSYNYLLDAVVYSPDKDVYISQSGWGGINDFIMRSELQLPFGDDEIRALLRSEPVGLTLMDASAIQRGGTRVPGILLLRPLSYAKTSEESRVYILATLNLPAILSGIIDNFQGIIITDQNGNLLFDSSRAIESGEKIDLSLSNDGVHKFRDREMITFGGSRESNLRFGLITDKSVFTRYITIAISLGIAFFLLSLVLTLILVLIRVKKEWAEYDMAIKQVGEVERSKAIDSPYAPFVSSAEALKEKHDILKSVVEAQSDSLREHMLFNLVALSDKTMGKKALSECGVDFKWEDFIVVVATPRSEGEREEATIKLTESLSLEGLDSYIFSEEPLISFVVSVDLSHFKSESEFYGVFAKRMTRLLEEEKSIQRISSSDLSHGMESLGADYLDAVNVNDWEESVDVREFMVHRDLIGTLGKTGFSYTTEDEIRLQEAIERGDEVKSGDIFERIVSHNRELGSSPRNMRYLLFAVMNTVVGVSNKLTQQYDWSLPAIHFSPIIQSVDFNKSFSEVSSTIRELSMRVNALREEEGGDSNKYYLIYKKSMKIIQDEYSNPMMNVQYIANRLLVSNAFLSRIFKKYHGINISEYLAEYRIMQSKILLSSGAKIDEVVSSCGFGSTRTYLRLFKKYENVTPSQFKEKRIGNENEKA